MDSVISLIVITLFIIIVYGFASIFYDKHKYHKKLYMMYNPKYDENGYDKDRYDENEYDKYGYNRKGYNKNGYDKNGYDNDGYSRNGYNKDGKYKKDKDRKNDDKKSWELSCSDAPCKHKGTCVIGSNTFNGKTYNYSCNCKNKYLGYNCEHKKGDPSSPGSGVGVKLLENIDKLTSPIMMKKEPLYGLGNNTWNNYL